MTHCRAAYLYVASERHAITSDRLGAADLVWRGYDLGCVLKLVCGFFDGRWPPYHFELDGMRRVSYPRIELPPDQPRLARAHVALKLGLIGRGGVSPTATLLAGWWGDSPDPATRWSELPPLPLTHLLWDQTTFAAYLQASALAVL